MCGCAGGFVMMGFPQEDTLLGRLPSYLARHVVAPSQVRFSRNYCSECRLSYDILKTYGGAMS